MNAPGFIEPELCRITQRPPDGPGWVHEIKLDGYRMQAHIAQGKARLFSRNGLDWSHRFPEIAKACGVLPDCILDGEIVALDDAGISNFAQLQDALSAERTGPLVYFLFDLLFLEGADLRKEPLERRKDALEQILAHRAGKQQRLRYVGHLAAQGTAILDAACRMNLEGVISKRLNAPYRSGRSDNWVKAKCRGGQEVVVGGWWGDAKHLRSLLVGAHREDGFAYLGRVGTGFNARNTDELLKRLLPLRRKTMPFLPHTELARKAGIVWAEPKLVVETEFSSVTSAGLLRQASFKGLREDKPAQMVQAEPVPHTSRVAMGRAKPMTINAITVSHPEKILWPADGAHPAVTKADLAAYYQMAATRILPFVAGRPVSLVRAPDGIGGQHFFQRHEMEGMAGTSSIAVAGESKPYLAINDTAGLIGAAQGAGLEMHPWGCKKGDPETPEILIFDLDPAPDVPFEQVIAAAKDLAVVLRACGLKAFVKTTGGKGLHVVTPIRSTAAKPASWKDAKAFARDICLAVEATEPARYTTNMAKAKRG
ncbi:MAG TPA: DNA ligase D, partial [Rhizomicrobium sp.]|nr:DNA ligase D [Rhizomicrobium sp.]